MKTTFGLISLIMLFLASLFEKSVHWSLEQVDADLPPNFIYLPVMIGSTSTNLSTTVEQVISDILANSMDTYRVQPGDRLAKIARNTGISLELLLLANPEISNPDIIFAGQQLRIPNDAQVHELQLAQARWNEEEQIRVVNEINPGDERWIDVDLDTQTLRAYEGRQVAQTFSVSTGTWRTPTITGQYEIWIKLESDDMSGPGYFLEDVPYVMYFYKGYGLHGTYWHDNFGVPMSHGCVNLSVDDAQWLFEFAEVGTLVNIH